ncbi:MAG: ATP-binding cassette domain-containing protein [Gemmatimonadaceae bacterium]
MSQDVAHRASLELRSVSKRFVAGAGSCTIGVTALRRASAEIRTGEVLVVAGPMGSGKTTLLLCAAGLLRCDSGSVIGSARRVVYRDLLLPARPIDPITPGAVLLLDSCDALPDLARARAARVVAEALSIGASVVLAAREAVECFDLAPPGATISILHLRLGETSGREIPVANRVAEGGAFVFTRNGR